MLRVSLLGNMGGEPEVRFTQKGTQIVQVRVAVNQVRTGPDGERQENTEWFRIRASGPKGEFLQRLGKGTRILAIGRLDIGYYNARDGERRTSYDVWADEIQAMSSARPFSAPDTEALEASGELVEPAAAGVSSVSGSASPRATNGRPGRAATSNGEPKSSDLEDLPF